MYEFIRGKSQKAQVPVKSQVSGVQVQVKFKSFVIL